MSTASRRWVKVWHEILNDPDFQDMRLEQQARWYNLLVFISANGDKGTLEIDLNSRTIAHLFQCEISDIFSHLKLLKNIEIKQLSDNAKISVTFKKWSKYQIDSTSYERLKEYRKRHDDNGNDNASKIKNKNKIKNKIKNKEKDKEKDNYSFDVFFEKYPRKTGKQKALEAWSKINPSEDLTHIILNAVENQKKQPQWLKDNGQFIPHPATWLNQKRWEDVLTEGNNKGTTKTAGNWALLEKRKAEGKYET